MSEIRIRPKERDGILQALRAGVVPRVGQQHVQVARTAEVKAVLQDIERIADGGSTMRFVIGEYGSGKTFFLNLMRSIALEKRMVVCNADLNPDRRLHATAGQARSLFAELMRNVSTRSKPDGGAMESVVERFVSSAEDEGKVTSKTTEAVIHDRLSALKEMVGGYDFAAVIASYWRAHESDNEEVRSSAIRWLRAEYSAKTDARKALDVRGIVDDGNFYDQLKLMARFVRLAGYGGLIVCLDELVNLYKLANTQARTSNYEQILRFLNDSLQGTAVGLGFILGGTPEFLMDPRKGLFSYQALASRLEENSFAKDGLVDMTGPVIRLSRLTREDMFVLLRRLRHLYASGNESEYLLPDDALHAFMLHCESRIGDAYFRTPRNTVKAFIDLLAILDQNPDSKWTDLIERVDVLPDEATSGSFEGDESDDELATFRI